ncbi:4-hydroxy-3-methylbut-2-enyl diphosphate reductase [Woodsholea maritima]|uniref:4-hydroxy-3-methylbut-2-enyl diphosphate reductase n=1 Tax=Woodsholea maritima TaxID=240237 RepID=UPI00037A4407|nr:4-hydroxy-3-methylbut-2-enyl diphosphate reductase [Woodsholea maritima]
MTSNPKLAVFLASPRGFCAGVDRAIQIVEKALARYGAPVYVRHEIVHNKHVVNRLKAMGAIFVKELDECPDDRPVVFSAHGVPKSVPATAEQRDLLYVDATCPLVSKVHIDAERHDKAGREIILIGHAGHPEVIGTMGQLEEGRMVLIETEADAEAFTPRDPDNLAYVTQTTLSVDDTSAIVEILKRRFPHMASPHKEDICYATTNRQGAVKAIGPKSDLVLVVGAPNSSNSRRLVEVATRAGAKASYLVEKADDIDWAWFENISSLGVSAGASAPEDLVEDLLAAVAERFDITVDTIEVAKEDVIFKLPRAVAEA